MMMKWIVENWAFMVALLCTFILFVVWAMKFANKPSDRQIENIKSWLLYAVIEAEHIFQSGTGKLKLHYVYDQFISKFPTMSELISFEVFSFWVDEVLIDMREILDTNKDIDAYVTDTPNYK